MWFIALEKGYPAINSHVFGLKLDKVLVNNFILTLKVNKKKEIIKVFTEKWPHS